MHLILVQLLCSNIKDWGFLSFHFGILSLLTFVFISPFLVFVLLTDLLLLHMLRTPHYIVVVIISTEAFYLHTCIASLEKNPRIFPPVCFGLASSWSVMPTDIVITAKPNWWPGCRLACHFLDLSVTHRIWDWSLHTCLTFPCGSQQSSQLCDFSLKESVIF